MSFKRTCIIFSLIVLLLAGCTKATLRTAPASPDAHAYSALLERVKRSDSTVDFRGLRLLYTNTPDYDPVSLNSGDRDQMYTALDDERYKDALKLAQAVLKHNYVDMDAQYVAMEAFKGLGDQASSDHHGYVLKGLIESILESGDGLGPQTAFQIINVREEYIIMSVLGVGLVKQSVVETGGHIYDRMEVASKTTGEPLVLYFNVDIPFKAYEKVLVE